MIGLLVMTDGRRDCIARTIPSALDNLKGTISFGVIHDDSGDRDYRRWLVREFPDFEVRSTAGRSGFGGAIRSAWGYLETVPGLTYVFHLEDDFTFNWPVDLNAMRKILNARPYLVQLALRRQPWNDEERKAGGIVEQHPDDYEQQVDGFDVWLEHRRFFTTNPSLYRRSLLDVGWPDTAQSEGMFTHQLLADPEVRFGFWGARTSGQWVHHIGNQRVGTGY